MPNTFPDYVPTSAIPVEYRPNWRGPDFPDKIKQFRVVGLNQIEAEWRVEWAPYKVEDIDVMNDFLSEESRFNRSFIWAAPTYAAKFYRCSTWKVRHINCTWAELSAEFLEVYE